MPYTPQTWEDDKTSADASHLTHIESGVSAAQTAAEEAKTKAEAALTTNASNKTLAEEGKTKAEAAQTTANTAKTEANEGKTKANEAKTKSEESKTASTTNTTNLTTEKERAVVAENSLAGQTSQLFNIDEELDARISVLEARVGGIAGTGKPAVVTSTVLGGTHTPESIQFKAEVNPEGGATKWWFEWGPTEALGNATTHETLSQTDNAPHAVSQTVTTASPGTFTAGLFFRVAASNTNGESRGVIQTPSPTITMRPTTAYATTPVTNISATSITFNGTINPNGEATTLTWEYGTTTAYGSTFSQSEKPTGRAPVSISNQVTGLSLTPGGTYHYRLKAVNGSGTTNLADGTFVVGATNEVLIGDQTEYANEDKSSTGRVTTVPFTVLKSGTLEKLIFKTKKPSDTGVITSLRMGIIANSGGKPAIETVLAEGVTSAGAIKEENAEIVVTLSSPLTVTAGEELWLAILPIGGRIYLHSAVNSGTGGGVQTYQSAGAEPKTTITTVKTWEGEAGRQTGPWEAWGSGATSTGPTTPVLKLASNKEEVEWNSVGSETEYTVRVSAEPPGSTGRKTYTFAKNKVANPNKFKPEVGVTYGTTTTITFGEGQTVYSEIQVKGGSTFSNTIEVKLPKEEVPSGTLKGIEFGGWGKAEELEDAAEAKANITRLNKPTRSTIVEWENKGVKVIYLYAYDTGGQNKSGVKAINRTAWVADAIKRIKESKPLYFECLNEPAQDAFWGSGSTSEANAKAYIELLKLLKEEIVAQIPSEERPKIIASLDGGKDGEKTWVEDMKKSWGSNGFLEFFDIGSCHPYGGTGSRASAKLGHRDNVEAIHTYIGGSKDMCVTEVGFPTLSGTGDSLQYTEAEAAENFASFLGWAKALPWMKLVIIYGYRDGSEVATASTHGYGQWKLNDTPKLAVSKIAAA